MSEVSERYGRIAAGFGDRLAGVAPDQWSATTPCADWTTRDLVAHVIGTQRRVVATLEQSTAPDVDLDGDLAEQWRHASGAVAAKLEDEKAASTTVKGMFGEQSFESLVSRLACADTLVHTWDLARATGQDGRLDRDAVSKCIAFMAPMDEALRRPGGFAAKIAPVPSADEQTQLLNFCGRSL